MSHVDLAKREIEWYRSYFQSVVLKNVILWKIHHISWVNAVFVCKALLSNCNLILLLAVRQWLHCSWQRFTTSFLRYSSEISKNIIIYWITSSKLVLYNVWHCVCSASSIRPYDSQGIAKNTAYSGRRHCIFNNINVACT